VFGTRGKTKIGSLVLQGTQDIWFCEVEIVLHVVVGDCAYKTWICSSRSWSLLSSFHRSDRRTRMKSLDCFLSIRSRSSWQCNSGSRLKIFKNTKFYFKSEIRMLIQHKEMNLHTVNCSTVSSANNIRT